VSEPSQLGPRSAPVKPDASPDAHAVPSKLGEDDGLADVIRRELDQEDGINYERLARELGPSALNALRTVLDDPRPQIAAGAASLAGMIVGGMIEGASGFPVVAEAADNDESLVRAAVAVTLPTLVPTQGEQATRLVERLLHDDDIAVRGHALRSAARIGTPSLRERIRDIAAHDPSPDVQELAARLLGEPPQSAG
jgi:HEAT repeat protein